MRRLWLFIVLAVAVPVIPARPATAAARHAIYRDDGDCNYQDDDCNYDQRYDQNYGSRDDRNRNRHRNRGAFSPGPFDRSPVDAFNGNTICLPGSTCHSDGRRDQQPPPDEGEQP